MPRNWNCRSREPASRPIPLMHVRGHSRSIGDPEKIEKNSDGERQPRPRVKRFCGDDDFRDTDEGEAIAP